MEVLYDEETKTWITRPLTKKLSRPKVMKTKYIVAGVILFFAILGFLETMANGAASVPTCPRGYRYLPGSTWAGWARPCVPIGEDSSLDGIPAVNLNIGQ